MQKTFLLYAHVRLVRNCGRSILGMDWPELTRAGLLQKNDSDALMKLFILFVGR